MAIDHRASTEKREMKTTMNITLLTRVDILLTLGLYDLLRFVSKLTRRYADRIDRGADIDRLRGFHAYSGELGESR